MPKKQDFPLWVKSRLWRRRMSVRQLAALIGRNRSTVSTAIHHERHQIARAKIREALK